MLLNLHVKNMALIRELEIDFGKGFNILTGETGAGKSILIGSVNVALGMQSFKGFVREDTTSALVELVFSVESQELKKKIEMLEIPVEDEQVIISRRLINGRSISKVNGETVTLTQVRELASLLIDIHGQHEHQSLLHKKNHLQILDEYAKEKLAPYKEQGAEIYARYAKIRKKLEASTLDEAARKKESDFLQFEIEEIDRAELKNGEDEELEERFKKLSNARKIAGNAGEAYALTGDRENGESASDLISAAVQRLQMVEEFDEQLQGLESQLSEIENLLSDFNREMSGYLGDLTFDDYEFEQLEKRLDEINRLKVKYGQSITEILSYREEKAQRLEELLNYDSYLGQLQKEYEEQENLLRENAKKMSAIRKQYAEELAEQIRKELKDLNFLETNFEMEVTESAPLSANGFDEACFLISMNPGSPMRMLGDVASGGELSRIMLAIKTVLADKDQTDTLIFDEIDVGISGRTAQKVSEKMAVIARSRQVLCITHLAQIASMADHHFYIEKTVKNGATETGIRELNLKESEEELARILGGAQITETTLKSAREMKEMADATKKY